MSGTWAREGGAPQTEELAETANLPKRVLVLRRDRTHSVALRPRIEIGRQPSCSIRLDEDGSVSRLHAVLHVAAGTVFIEDLGSRNGTWVDGNRIAAQAPVVVTPSSSIAVGSAILRLDTKPLRIWDRESSESRIESLARAGTQFALFRFELPFSPTSQLIEAIESQLGRVDMLAALSSTELIALVEDIDRSTASRLAQEADLDEFGARLARLAISPEDGRTPDRLLVSALGGSGHGTAPPGFVFPDSGPMVEVFRTIERAARGSVSVLILGETGVGKEVIAESLHRGSPRRDNPFLRLNCAALSPNLVESELFGHEKGAFTGADRRKLGLFESASGGTVFLDEVGELPLEIQAKLLRVLEAQTIIRVGEVVERKIDVRLIAATNRNLLQEAAKGAFRSDLYYRLAQVVVRVPNLAARKSEIPALVERFIAIASDRESKSRPRLGPGALDRLMAYDWPGNIRELRNAIERAVLLAESPFLAPEDFGELDAGDYVRPPELPAEVRVSRPTVLPSPRPRASMDAVEETRENQVDFSRWNEMSDVEERAAIIKALEQVGGNQSNAAALLGISRRTLISRIEKYDLPRPRKK